MASMLTGCSISNNEGVEAALTAISRFNDKVQGLIFDPTQLAPTYPESMITRPFPFNAYYSEDEVRETLDLFCDNRLMLTEKDRYLSLALPLNPNW